MMPNFLALSLAATAQSMADAQAQETQPTARKALGDPEADADLDSESDEAIFKRPPIGSFDTDADGIADEEEVLIGLDPFDPNDGLFDRDDDGFDLAWEHFLDSDPADPRDPGRELWQIISGRAPGSLTNRPDTNPSGLPNDAAGDSAFDHSQNSSKARRSRPNQSVANSTALGERNDLLPTPEDSDGDGVPNDSDASPSDPAVDWPQPPPVQYIAISIGPVGQGWSLYDINNRGSSLLGKNAPAPQRTQFATWSPDGAFVEISPANQFPPPESSGTFYDCEPIAILNDNSLIGRGEFTKHPSPNGAGNWAMLLRWQNATSAVQILSPSPNFSWHDYTIRDWAASVRENAYVIWKIDNPDDQALTRTTVVSSTGRSFGPYLSEPVGHILSVRHNPWHLFSEDEEEVIFVSEQANVPDIIASLSVSETEEFKGSISWQQTPAGRLALTWNGQTQVWFANSAAWVQTKAQLATMDNQGRVAPTDAELANVTPPSGYTSLTNATILPNGLAHCTGHTSSGNTGPVLLLPVEFITPAGDPVNAPVDAGTTPASIPDGANEFTFSDATSGVLTMKLKVKVLGVASMPAAEQAKFTFEVDTIGNSTFAWDAANPGGKATFSGDFLTATATYTELPQNNSDFGLKNARVKHGGNNAGEAKFEVFFPIDAANPGRICNHPGGKMDTWDPVTRTLKKQEVPNWYYYWRQLPEAQGINLAYGGATINGAVPAYTDWGYEKQIDKTLILIGEQAYVAGKSYGVGEFVSGIDWYGNTLLHEGRHVWQIAQYDALVPTGTENTPWLHGWAINQGANHNHWTMGADGQPGEAGVDDDREGQVDNLFSAGPGELGKFNPATPAANRDQNLNHPNLAIQTWQNWPAALPYPNPMLHPQWEEESDAINHANANYNEHQNARKDWGNPGKNHKTIDIWND